MKGEKETTGSRFVNLSLSIRMIITEKIDRSISISLIGSLHWSYGSLTLEAEIRLGLIPIQLKIGYTLPLLTGFAKRQNS